MSSSATTTEPGPGGALPAAAKQLPTGPEKVKAVRQMFDAIAGRYELVNGIVSLGMDRGWRHRCVDALELPVGSVVLDVACGTGDLCRELDRRLLRPVGVDLSNGMLAHARSPGPLVHGDALFSPFRAAAFDGAVSGFALRNVTDLGILFVELARVTRPGGRISLLDLAEPEAQFLRLGHRLWTNYAVPLVGSALSGSAAYRYLPRSFAYLPPASRVVELLEQAGFAAVEHELLSGGISQLYIATRKHEAGTQ
ncbi:MAG TPA: class I SAM-dependent methyltransferase [Acidimicrobiales bacterium]|nr:class I SAM-dependent methyltransferase [Acidimicrobiales bacterium]